MLGTIGNSNADKPPKNKPERFGEPRKFLPVAFAICTILGLYLIYVIFHCIPMMQLDVEKEHRDVARRSRGILQMVVLNIMFMLLVICYLRSILQHPGEVPDDDPLWEFHGDGKNEQIHLGLQEMKRSGDRRHCKWCGKYKPDRCHHCRVCRQCVLKMDHHCPWIYNCVGFRNFKYFYLLLVYGVCSLHLIIWSMVETLVRSLDLDTPVTTMFFVFFGETLAVFLGALLTVFLGFHTWMLLKAMTTIEFCEKKMPKSGKETQETGDTLQTSVYDLGLLGNIEAAFGPNPITWLVPVAPDIGEGLIFVTGETRLARDFEVGKGIRRKTHQTIQRPRLSPAPSSERLSGSLSACGNARTCETDFKTKEGP